MSFGQVLEKVMADRGETQDVPAQVAHVSSAYISKIVRGNRPAPNDVMRSMAMYYDEPMLSVAAAEEVTGGTCSPWLTGADLHKSNVYVKTIEEIQEVIESMNRVPITKRKDQLSEADSIVIRKSIMESIEAITALTHNVAVLCKEYDVSWKDAWAEHRREMKAKHYLD